ncbi:hypothetical protein Tco_0031725 [Tanacetum coccineum]
MIITLFSFLLFSYIKPTTGLEMMVSSFFLSIPRNVIVDKSLSLADKPAKKPATRRQSVGFKSETLLVWVLDVSEADSSESEYESWGDSDDDNDDDDQQSGDERTESDDDDKAADISKTDDEEEDDFVHIPDDYVPTDDENVDDEEYEHVNKEMYSDVNMELKDSEHESEGKDDEEMTDDGQGDAEHEEVSQEVAGDQVKDDAQATVTTTLDAQKTEVPLQSSSISSDYATKFLNFDNIPSGKTRKISMIDVEVQHEDPTTTSTTAVPDSETLFAIHKRLSNVENEVKTLINIDHSSTIHAAVKSEVSIVVKEYLGTSLDDALHKALQRYTTELVKEHSVLVDVTDVLKQQPKPQKSVADFRKIKMKQARKQQEPKYTIVSSDHKALYHALMESILENKDAIDKGVADKLKKRKPDDADRDEGPPAGPDQRLKRKKTGKETEPSKKAKSTKTSKGTTKSQPKSTGKSAQAKETVFVAGDTQVPQDLGEDTSNTDEPPIVNVDPKDWFKKPERPPTLDPGWNEGKSVENKPNQKWICDLAKAEKPSKTFNDLMSTPIDFSAFVMNRLNISDLTQDILVGLAYELLKGTCISYVELDYNMEECYKELTDKLDYNNPEGDRYPFDLSKPLPLVKSVNRQIILVDYFFNNDLAYLQGGNTDRTYTTFLTKTKAAKYDLPGIEYMGPKRQRFYGYASKRVSKHDVYSTKIILVVKNVKVNIWYGYGYLEEIEFRRSDQQLYKFMEGDFPRLHLNDIEDMLLLVVQNRLFNLKGEDIVHLAIASCMFTRRIVIQKRVEDIQLGIESYQKKLNISKPRTRKGNLSQRAPYTTLSDPQRVIYKDKLNIKRLMRSDELYKFRDVIFMDTAYGSSQIRRIGNWSNALSCEVLALIRRISFVGYGVCSQKSAFFKCDLDNSTNNVLIPLDSWTSGLLVYRLPLSVEYGVSNPTEYGVSSSLSNIAYSSQQINTAANPTDIFILVTERTSPTETNLSITSNDIEVELNDKFWVELQKNIYQGTYNEDVVEHIAKALKFSG